MGKTANIIGATGLVGRALTAQLLADERYDRVRVFVRRSTGMVSAKLDERLVDFDRPEQWQQDLAGDELYSALGTTIKRAGSKENQYRVDYTYQWNAAQAAAANGVQRYLLVSASGADPTSRIFYSRMKGELDAQVEKLPFARIDIFRPSLLLGDREVPRLGERVAEWAFKPVQWIPGLRRYRPIPAATVAAAMVAAANRPADQRVAMHSLDELFELASGVLEAEGGQ